MNSDAAERMPLHSFPISMSAVGRENLKPSLENGMPDNVSSAAVTSVDPFCKAKTNVSMMLAGIGIVRERNSSGKTTELSARTP